MTDHYAEAERLLAESELERETGGDVDYAYAPDVRRELRDRATVHATLAAIPPYPKTAEDLRGAEAEIARLNAIIDGMPYPSEVTRRPICAAGHPENNTVVPCGLDEGHFGPHWSTTGCAGSVSVWPNPPSGELVEKIARKLHALSSPGHGAVCVDLVHWRGWISDACAVLAAIGGE